ERRGLHPALHLLGRGLLPPRALARASSAHQRHDVARVPHVLPNFQHATVLFGDGWIHPAAGTQGIPPMVPVSEPLDGNDWRDRSHLDLLLLRTLRVERNHRILASSRLVRPVPYRHVRPVL